MTLKLERVADWNKAYAIGAAVAGGSAPYFAMWSKAALNYRSELPFGRELLPALPYGPHARQVFDLFRPRQAPLGLVVFVHGGFWHLLDGRYWSHFAEGALQRGFAVAVPTYRLCPEVRIADITLDVASAIGAAAVIVDGPIHLVGHSAGGHLVSRMTTTTSPLAPPLRARLRQVVSISGLHDLRPLMNTNMNDTLHIDAAEAAVESPALGLPLPRTRLTAWVGADELSEFIRQTELLPNVWLGLGAETAVHCEAGKHHFDVIDGLVDPNHPLTCSLLD